MQLREDRIQYNSLVETWWARLYGIAWSKTADRDIAHDLVQEVFLTVWNKWDMVPRNEEIEYYLLHVLRYKVLNHYRSSGRYKIQLQQLDELLERLGEAVEDTACTDERLVFAREAIALLPPSLREVFTLRIEKGYSYNRIGALLDMEPASARVLYSRALSQLRKTVAARPVVAVSMLAALQMVTIC